MAEHRKFSSVICVKTGAKTAAKIELFPAEQWLESAQGRYRLRINRRWHDFPEGGMAFLDARQVSDLVAGLATGESPDLATAPDLECGTPVSVPNGRILAGEAMRDVTRTATPLIRAYDGEWYAGVHLVGKGSVFVNAKDIIKKQRR